VEASHLHYHNPQNSFPTANIGATAIFLRVATGLDDLNAAEAL
jgi:hypothetical protein